MDNITQKIASNFIQNVFTTVFHFDFLPARKYFLKVFTCSCLTIPCCIYFPHCLYSPHLLCLLIKVGRHSRKMNGVNCLKQTNKQTNKKPQTTQVKLSAFINFSYQEVFIKNISSHSLEQRTLGRAFHSTHSYKIAMCYKLINLSS